MANMQINGIYNADNDHVFRGNDQKILIDSKIHGNVFIAAEGEVVLQNVRVYNNGTLDLGGVKFKPSERNEEFIKYYNSKGLDIQYLDDEIIFNGEINIDRNEIKHMFANQIGKYTLYGWHTSRPPKDNNEMFERMRNSASYGTYSKSMMENKLVFSDSKNKSVKKVWSSRSIDDKFNVNKAAFQVFAGRLRHELVSCEFVPKVRFDVFSRTVVTKEPTKNACDLLKDNKIGNHVLMNYIYEAMFENSADVFAAKLAGIVRKELPKPEPKPNIETKHTPVKSEQQGYFSGIFAPLNLFFGPAEVHPINVAIPTAEILPKQEVKPPVPKPATTHARIVNAKPKDISKEDLSAALEEAIECISKDDFAICSYVKEKIMKDFNEVNNKFAEHEVKEVISTVDSLVTAIRSNVAVAKQQLSELRDDEPEEKQEVVAIEKIASSTLKI